MAFTDDLIRHPRFQLWSLDELDVRSHLRKSAPESFADAVRDVFALYAKRQGKARYGDKTPDYVLHLPLLAELFPEARFIHIIRDGRDVALSHLNVQFGPNTIEEAAFWWKRFVKRGRAAGRTLGPSRYLEVKYEDLIEQPQVCIEQICGFIDLKPDPAMLKYYERAREIVRGSAFPNAHQRLALPITKGLRNWRSQMKFEDVAVFEVIAGDLLSDLGYERAVARPAGVTWLAGSARHLRVEARRIAHAVAKRTRRAAVLGSKQKLDRT
jgi:hypothetical protein